VTNREISDDFRVPKEESFGVVIVSFTHAEGVYDSYAPTCAYRGTNNEVSGWTKRGNSGIIPLDKTIIYSKTTTNLFGKAAILGRVVAVELPAGTYEFFRCASSGVFVTSSTVPELSIKFSVTPGEVAYLGNIRFIITPSRSPFDTFSRADFDIFVDDRHDRDFEIVRRAWPNIAVEQIKTALAQYTRRAFTGN
jgi:hypothetical protein